MQISLVAYVVLGYPTKTNISLSTGITSEAFGADIPCGHVVLGYPVISLAPLGEDLPCGPYSAGISYKD